MNQNKLNLTQALVVEGKYDAARLANLSLRIKPCRRSSNALPPPRA